MDFTINGSDSTIGWGDIQLNSVGGIHNWNFNTTDGDVSTFGANSITQHGDEILNVYVDLTNYDSASGDLVLIESPFDGGWTDDSIFNELVVTAGGTGTFEVKHLAPAFRLLLTNISVVPEPSAYALIGGAWHSVP